MPSDTAEIVLLHNPHCSKSRQVKALLAERAVEFTERRYLEQPLEAEELRALAAKLGRTPAEFVRSKEAAYAAAGLSDSSSADEVLQAMAAHPVLMERPILIHGARAAVGRPPEDVLELL